MKNTRIRWYFWWTKISPLFENWGNKKFKAISKSARKICKSKKCLKKFNNMPFVFCLLRFLAFFWPFYFIFWKSRHLLLGVGLDLLHPILNLQVNLRLLKRVPNDSPYPKHGVWHQNHVSIMFRTKVRNFLLDMVQDLLHPILDLQVNLMLLKMVPNDSPYPKT